MASPAYDPDDFDRLVQQAEDDLLDGRSILDQLSDLLTLDDPEEG